MYLVIIGWLYVALMMAVAEATNSTGSILGAIVTFALYGALPIGLLIYLMTTPARKRALKARQERETREAAAERSGAPDAGGESAADPVAPVREKE